MRTRALYIEDEQFLGRIVKDTLEKKGFEVVWVTDGSKVMKALNDFSPDICIVDIMLPNVDGFTLAKNIRGLYPEVPIIFLTARSETKDVIMGFESGGTDYLKKPFSLEELLVRIDNQLKLHNGTAGKSGGDPFISLGEFIFKPDLFELGRKDKTIKLSYRDTEILSILAANKNQVVDRKDLLLSVWGDDSFFNSRNLDVYIRKLRSYFEDDPAIQIKTLKGKGYVLIC